MPKFPLPIPPAPAPDATRPSLRVGVSWTLAGYGVYMACQWAFLIVVARLGSPAQVGELALGLALSGPVILFSNLGLRKVQVTDVHGQFQFADYFGLRLAMTALALVVIAAMAGSLRSGGAAAAAVVAVGLAKAVEAASDMVYGVFQRGERMDLIAASLFLRGILSVGLLALGMSLTHDVAIGMAAVAAGWLAVLLVHDLPRARGLLGTSGAGLLRPRWSGRILARLAWLALPLGIVTPLAALLGTVPAVLIENLKGPAELGIYTALAYSYSASNRIASAMGEAASARLAAFYARGERGAFARVLGGLLAIAGLVGLLGLALAGLAGRPILTVLYGPAYGARADILVGFMAVAIAGNLACVLDYSMTAMRQLRIQPLVAAASVALLGLLSSRLIPTRGLGGAVLSLGAVALFQGAATLGVVVLGWVKFPPLAGRILPEEA
ncbi:MAG TPA: lipopolysaccharide biosynthesis protein [Planctomycetota bacterium]|nr:lipopolysaccharide biosynthesis protein [Planctomycetota bacterium]